MKLLSINIGKRQIQQNAGKDEVTGIFKRPVQVPMLVSRLGFSDDFIGSPKHHGGPDQAVYVYGETDYRWWEKELGTSLEAGMFGENLTISDLESDKFNIGDILHIGEVILQVTAPRIPCGTFARHMGDPQWVKRFRAAERPGFYCRVLREGMIQAGNDVTVKAYEGETLSLVQMYRDFYDKNKSEETIRKHLNAPIAIRAREALEK